MDWKHILSANVEELSDDEKEEFYNKIAWFNSDTEQISSKKLWALFKVSQDILKYKGEQVETLLHELDELATKQGEEEARKLESDTARSSRKSSSIEFESKILIYCSKCGRLGCANRRLFQIWSRSMLN